MIQINSEKEIKIEKNYLVVDSEHDNLVISLYMINHVKLEKKEYNHTNLVKAGGGVLYLYNHQHTVLHKLLFKNIELAMKVYYAMQVIIINRKQGENQ